MSAATRVAREGTSPPRSPGIYAGEVHPAEWERHPGPRALPARTMPRWASRLTLEITAVAIARVQSITADEARAEGATWGGRWGDSFSGLAAREAYGDDIDRTVAAFAARWDEINGPGMGWAADPFVWAITFRRVETEAGDAHG